ATLSLEAQEGMMPDRTQLAQQTLSTRAEFQNRRRVSILARAVMFQFRFQPSSAACAFVSFLLLLILTRCSSSVLRSRSQSPEPHAADEPESLTKYVGDFAVPYGTSYTRVEGPVLITGLAGTGSDPAPGPQRSALLADMEAHNVVQPSKVL